MMLFVALLAIAALAVATKADFQSRRDREEELAAAVREAGVVPISAPPSAPVAREEALSALLNLGMARQQAERALERVATAVGPDAEVEVWVRTALKGLAR